MPSFFTGAESIAHRNDTPLLESRANAAPVVGGLACPPGAGGHASPRSKRNSKRPKCTHSAQAAPERAFRRTRGSPGSAPGAAGVGDGRGKGEEGGAEEQLSSSSLPLPPVRSASGRILFAAATRSGFPPRFRPLLRRERKGGGRPRGGAWPADPPARTHGRLLAVEVGGGGTFWHMSGWVWMGARHMSGGCGWVHDGGGGTFWPGSA